VICASAREIAKARGQFDLKWNALETERGKNLYTVALADTYSETTTIIDDGTADRKLLPDRQGSWPVNLLTTSPDGDTITAVKKKPSFNRRKLSTVVRKAITSYYAEEEQRLIAKAAKQAGISMSSFVATAALAEARRRTRTH
jgi:hypothetical protein